MKLPIYTALAAFFTCVLSLQAASVDEVLSKMDAAAPKFTSMSANISRTTYTKVLDEKQTESGTVMIRRNGKEMQLLMNVTKPDPKVMAFRGKKAETYLPRLQTVQEIDLGKFSSMVDQFLALGFGVSGRELKSSYDPKLLGEETVAGQKAYKLQLTPRNAKLREAYPFITLWVHESGAYPVQQQVQAQSGDYYLFTYSDIKLNPGLTDEALKLKVPKGTKREVLNK
jgi:outer membrane lipoprotein-sorting protein